jgi:hypothetical protein
MGDSTAVDGKGKLGNNFRAMSDNPSAIKKPAAPILKDGLSRIGEVLA